LAQLDADYGNLDRQLTSALAGLYGLPELDLKKPETIRKARIGMQKVVAHLKKIPGANAASHASAALHALRLTYETRFSLNSFQTARGAMRLSFELFEHWAQSQLLLQQNEFVGPTATGAVAGPSQGSQERVEMPYKPKLPPKTVSMVTTHSDESGDGCSDIEADFASTPTIMAVSRDEFGKYNRCPNCLLEHPLAKCPGFRAMTDAQKVGIIRKNRACYRCMLGRHPKAECPKTWTCRECQSPDHHTLLHGAFDARLIMISQRGQPGSQPPPPPPPAGSSGGNPTPPMNTEQIMKLVAQLTAQLAIHEAKSGNNHNGRVAMPVCDEILRTLSYLVAPALLYHPLTPDMKHRINAVIDTCAESCFMTERIASILGLAGKNQPQILKLLSTTVTIPSRLVQFGISSTNGNHHGLMIANTVKEIQRSIKPPDLEALRKRFPYLNDITFPDKTEGDQIDLLIGLEYFEWMAPYLVRYEGRDKPCVLHTLLGPVIMFGEPRNKSLESFQAPVGNMSVTVLSTNMGPEEEVLTDELTQSDSPADVLSILWRYDVIGIDSNLKRPDKPFSMDEQRAWDILSNGITILPNLALQIPIPWMQNEPVLEDNRDEVRRAALRQERRWEDKDPKVLKTANQDIQVQKRLGFIRLVSPKEYMSTEGRYLHWVLVHRQDKNTTKVRIVFDASRRADCDGKSLNGCMLPGPVLLNEVFDVHNGNRERPVLITADVSKMFPRFKIPPIDRPLHRFWWQGQVYEFSSLIFGTVAAPFMANFGVLHLAKTYAKEYPHILDAVKRGIYVDDLSISLDTKEEARKYIDDFITVYEPHDLPFRQWSSNIAEVVEHLPKDWLGKGMVIKPEESLMAQKTLGMTWHPKEDILTFAVQPWDKGPVTTLRRLSSYAPTLFDPQGLLLPLTLIAKIIISVICAARAVVKVDWDTPLEPLIPKVHGLQDVLEKWIDYTDSLSELPAISFPRAVRSGPATTIQLHLFTDASEMAYGAVIYMRSVREDENIEVHILCAKNRVAHLGQARTIAEMELLGILCGARMVDRVISTLARIDKVFLWTDSRVCLHWIAKPARQWKSFVAH
jgi:hypothetical protein